MKFNRSYLPHYSELVLYTQSIAFVSLFIIDSGFRKFLNHELENIGDIFFLLIVFVFGITLSILNVFINRKKGQIEKTIMLVFMIISNLIIAEYTLTSRPFSEAFTIENVPPIINLLYSMWLIFSINKLKDAGEQMISDQDAKTKHAMTITIFVLATIGLFKLLGMSWNHTYALSVTLTFFVVEFIERRNVRVTLGT